MRTILAIDQTPSRASYGLLTQDALRHKLVSEQKQAVREDIGRTVAEGNRMAHIETGENAIVEIAAEAYLSEAPPEVVLQPVERPSFHVAEITGGRVNIFI